MGKVVCLLRDSKKEYEHIMARISKLDTFIPKLYEDNVEGKISDNRLMKMSAAYEKEQKQLENRVAEWQISLDGVKEKSAKAESFLKMLYQFVDI